MNRSTHSVLAFAAGLCVSGIALAQSPVKPNDQMKAVLDAQAMLSPKPVETLTPNQARLQPSAADGVIQLIQQKGVVAPDKLPPDLMCRTTD